MQPRYQLITNGGSVTTTTAYQTVPNLTFPVAAGATYQLYAWIMYQGSGTTAVFQASVGGTCTVSYAVYQVRMQTNVNGASNSQVQAGALSLPSGTPAGSAVNAASTNYGTTVEGLVVVSGSGTLDIVVKHGTAACTVQSGGRYLLEQVA